MDNPFDQFDAPGATSNPFDQFDAHAMQPAGLNAETAADVGKSAVTGLTKGAIGLPGIPGSLVSMGKGIGDWINRKEIEYGLTTPEKIAQFEANRERIAKTPPTSADIIGGVESATGKRFYEPKTIPGQYAETIGEFAPNAIGGPGNIATRAATRVMAPAVTSETAGQLTKGTALEPYARVAGALIPHGARDVWQSLTPVPRNAPTLEDLYQSAHNQYEAARNYGVEIRRPPVARLADDIYSDLHNDGFRQINVPKTWNAVEELKNPAGRFVTISDLDSVRKALLKAGSNPMEGAEREAARRAISSIDNYVSSLDRNPSHVAINQHFAGDLAETIRGARGDWAAMERSKLIEGKLESAADRAGSTYSGSNIDNATRQNIRQILNSPKLRRGFSDDEVAKMRQIVRGTAGGNIARRLGKLSPEGPVSGIVGVELGHLATGNVAGALGIPLVGKIAKIIGDRSTARKVQELSEMVRLRSPLGRSYPQPVPPGPVSLAPYARTGLVGQAAGQEEGRAAGGGIEGEAAEIARASGGRIIGAKTQSEVALSQNAPGTSFRCGTCEYFAKGKCHNENPELKGRSVKPHWCCNLYDHPGMEVIRTEAAGRAAGGRAEGGPPDDELSPEDAALAATMTHYPEAPNPAAPYLRDALNFARAGVSGVMRGRGAEMPSWSNQVGDVLTSEPANWAMGMAPPLGMASPAAMALARKYVPTRIGEEAFRESISPLDADAKRAFIDSLYGDAAAARDERQMDAIGRDTYRMEQESGFILVKDPAQRARMGMPPLPGAAAAPEAPASSGPSLLDIIRKAQQQSLTRDVTSRGRSGRPLQSAGFSPEADQRILEEGYGRFMGDPVAKIAGEAGGSYSTAMRTPKEILAAAEPGMVKAYNEGLPSIEEQYRRFAGQPWSYREITPHEAEAMYGYAEDVPPELRSVLDEHGKAVMVNHQNWPEPEFYAPHEAPPLENHMRRAVEDANGLLPASNIRDVYNGLKASTDLARYSAAPEAFAALAREMGWEVPRNVGSYMTIRHPGTGESLHVRISDHPQTTKFNPKAQTPDINLAPGAHDFGDAVRIMQNAGEAGGRAGGAEASVAKRGVDTPGSTRTARDDETQSALLRQVLSRGRSGRPIQSAPFSPEADQRILEEGYNRAIDPFFEGKNTISYALNNMFSGKIKSAPISVPEGGAGIHAEWNPGTKQLNIDNVDFERKGTGAFSSYLDHIENLSRDNGAKSVRMESILNDRLIPFLESRGYVIERSAQGRPNAVKDLVPPSSFQAYHGSPHDFERFDLSKIGTGEGAQAYGHGLYFAEEPGVAKNYRNVLSSGPEISYRGNPVTRETVGQIQDPDLRQRLYKSLLWDQGKTTDDVIAELNDLIRKRSKDEAGLEPRWGVDPVMFNDWKREVAALEKHKNDVSIQPGGKLYQVAIKADPEHFLDWDKPLHQQSEVAKRLPQEMRDQALKAGEQNKAGWGDFGVGTDAQDYATGQMVLKQLTDRLGSQEAATQALRSAGIPGIKYLDQGSRAAGEGSRNYVVFDDKLIDILKKYGLAGMIAGGAYHFRDSDLPQRARGGRIHMKPAWWLKAKARAGSKRKAA